MSSLSISRRRFLHALGLGAGARVLAPIAGLLHGQAWGQSTTQKKVVFISMGAGLPDLQLGLPNRRSETDWDIHEALKPLEPWRQRTAIVSGLTLFTVPGSQHSLGYGMLSCTATEGNADADGAPGAQTLDQHLGERLSAGTSMRSILFGIDNDEQKTTHQSLFAAAKNQPVPYPVQAGALFERLFPNSAANAARSAQDRRVLDALSADIRRVRGRLAGEERLKLDGYLASIDAFDRRRAAQMCSTAAPAGSVRGAVAEIPQMLDMAAVALRCGMSNVVGCAIGGGNSHYHFPRLKGPHLGTRFEAQGFVSDHGHDPEPNIYPDGRTIAWKWLSTEVANFLRALEAPLPDGRRLSDETVVVLFSDSGPDHHNGESQRFVVIGDLGGALRLGGRYLVHRDDVWWEPPKPGTATVNSLWTALATGLGAPLSSFGQLTGGRSSAPLLALLP